MQDADYQERAVFAGGMFSGVWSSRLNRKKGSYLFCQDTRADMLKTKL